MLLSFLWLNMKLQSKWPGPKVMCFIVFGPSVTGYSKSPMSITSPLCTLVNLHNDKICQPAYQPWVIRVHTSVYIVGTVAAELMQETLQTNGETDGTAPSAHIQSLWPPLCPPQSSFLLQACQLSGHKMKGLNINPQSLYQTLTHALYDHTISKKGLDVILNGRLRAIGWWR